MDIALLTSSRADYSIYYPLIKKIKENSLFKLDIITFGTHNSSFYGKTADLIKKDGFNVAHKVENLVLGESPESITDSMGLTFMKFSKIWALKNYKLCFVLGDRFEMFAAAYSTAAFNIPLAHISGGEQTLGAIDNAFRDAITTLAVYHFASTETYAERIRNIKGNSKNIYNVGALSIDNLNSLTLFSKKYFQSEFGIDMNKPAILITFHPETVGYEMNECYIKELLSALDSIQGYQFIITMPNADTMGSVIRNYINKFIATKTCAYGIESFGTVGYLSCMKYCSFMLGNSSSGFVEASYFPKTVINIGSRQTGRIVTPNIINCKIKKEEILASVKIAEGMLLEEKIETYGDGSAAVKIVNILMQINEKDK